MQYQYDKAVTQCYATKQEALEENNVNRKKKGANMVC